MKQLVDYNKKKTTTTFNLPTNLPVSAQTLRVHGPTCVHCNENTNIAIRDSDRQQ